ncbi:MAG TPA: hypothetical protein VK753_02935, partial [Xanthomonadaceae bacterium]|nr:hypothetical protein [Xanthomonadaceae bacterium]
IDADLDASAATSVKELSLDFASILRLNSHFEKAEKAAIDDKNLVTALGTFSAVDDLVPKLSQVWQKTDGQGKPVGEKEVYWFYKTGFWTVQRLVFGFYCDNDLGQDPKEIANMKDIRASSDKDKVEITEGPVKVKLSGLDVDRITAKHTYSYFGRASVADEVRWVASDHDILYMFYANSAGGSSIQRNLIDQVNSRSLTCKPRDVMDLGMAPAATGNSTH